VRFEEARLGDEEGQDNGGVSIPDALPLLRLDFTMETWRSQYGIEYGFSCHETIAPHPSEQADAIVGASGSSAATANYINGFDRAVASSSRVETATGFGDDESDDESDDEAYEAEDESDDDEDEEYVEHFGEGLEDEEIEALVGKNVLQASRQAIEEDEEGASGDIRQGTRRIFHNPDNFEWLPLGPQSPPKSFLKKRKADTDEKHAQARVYAVEYFQRKKDEAAKVDWGRPLGLEQPFCRKTLRIFQDANWTADRLADVWLSGQSDYVRYLSGLPRPRTTEEHKAIPAPTSEQLQGTIVYSNLIETPDKLYRYGGSGTGQDGGGSRPWQYNKLLEKFHNTPANEQVVSDFESHMTVMLRPDSECHMRIVLSWPRENILPDVAIVMEAAQVDLERYMNGAVPSASDDNYWARLHSEWIRDHSYASFPEGRTEGDFIGLNRAHPLRQGANCSSKKHRARVCKKLGWVCSLCRLDKSQRPEASFKAWRLASEVFFPIEEVVAFCGRCVRAWRRVEVRNEATARELLKNPPVTKSAKLEAQLNAQGGTCAYCTKPTTKPSTAYLEGFEGQLTCYACSKSHLALLERNPNPTEAEVADYLAQRKALAQKPEPGSEAQSKSCFACGGDNKVHYWLTSLKGFENRRACEACNIARGDIPKSVANIVSKPTDDLSLRAWLKWRMSFREDRCKTIIGYTSTGEGNGAQCPCCSGLDKLNGNSCELDDHEDIWACDDCVEAWPDHDEHTMSAWYEFAVDRKLASKDTIHERATAAAHTAAALSNSVTRTWAAAATAAPNGQHVCKKCGKSFKTHKTLRKHEIHVDCTTLSRVDQDMATAMAANPGKWVCHKCGAVLQTRDNLRMHFNNATCTKARKTTEENKAIAASSKHTCDKCGKGFVDHNGLVRHRKINCTKPLSALDEEMAKAAAANPDKHVCHRCGTPFKLKNNLRTHFRDKKCKALKNKVTSEDGEEAEGGDSGVQRSQPTRSTRSKRSTAAAAKAKEQDSDDAFEQESDDE
jgi:ribosomal protein L40E